MQVRRFIVGLLLVGLCSGAVATGVAAEPLAPGLPDVPIPAVAVPEIDPQNPQIPTLPYVPIPEQLQPLTGLVGPVTPLLCEASYLGPLAGVVVMTAIFQQVAIQPPVPPSFLGPLFGPVITACVLTPFPAIESCGPDAEITAQLATVGAAIPAPDTGVGGVPTVDPFATSPAPFASIVVELLAIQNLIASTGVGTPVDVAWTVSSNLGCS